MMDEEEYIKKACTKLQVYALNGIIPSMNFWKIKNSFLYKFMHYFIKFITKMNFINKKNSW